MGGGWLGQNPNFFLKIWNGGLPLLITIFTDCLTSATLIVIVIVIIIYEHFYRLPNLATLDMSRNKIVEIEQGAFEGAYSIDEMWVFVFVFVLGFEGTHSIDEMWVTDDMMVFVMMMMLMVRKVSKKQIKSHG